jgi:hypothetical protein
VPGLAKPAPGPPPCDAQFGPPSSPVIHTLSPGMLGSPAANLSPAYGPFASHHTLGLQAAGMGQAMPLTTDPLAERAAALRQSTGA